MAARIDLIRALVRQPWILCLDQPDAPLDLDGIKRLIEHLKELKGKTTILLVSGNPTLLALTDTRIVIAIDDTLTTDTVTPAPPIATVTPGWKPDPARTTVWFTDPRGRELGVTEVRTGLAFTTRHAAHVAVPVSGLRTVRSRGPIAAPPPTDTVTVSVVVSVTATD